MYTETSSLRTLKIMPRNLNEILSSWIRLKEYCNGGGGGWEKNNWKVNFLKIVVRQYFTDGEKNFLIIY